MQDLTPESPEVLWELAAAMETSGPVPAGRPMTVEETYEAALGCR
ncbi:MAG: hypothetical protein ACRDPP_14355 [Gaiellaceae bacterium]